MHRRRKDSQKRLLTLAAILLFAGCIATGTKVTESQLTQFERGRTTYAEVTSVLGQPTHTTLAADGARQAEYFYSQSQVRAANYLPIVGAFVRGADTEHTHVSLGFDAQGILTWYTATQGSQTVGTGITSGAKQ